MSLRLLQFLQEDNGNLSSTRLLFLSWGFVVLFSWSYLSIAKNAIQPVDSSVAAILGSLGVTKIVQKFTEEKTTK
jgi:hypothetical protein